MCVCVHLYIYIHTWLPSPWNCIGPSPFAAKLRATQAKGPLPCPNLGDAVDRCIKLLKWESIETGPFLPGHLESLENSTPLAGGIIGLRHLSPLSLRRTRISCGSHPADHNCSCFILFIFSRATGHRHGSSPSDPGFCRRSAHPEVVRAARPSCSEPGSRAALHWKSHDGNSLEKPELFELLNKHSQISHAQPG